MTSEVFDITRYGAVGDGKTVNTKAIQAAVDACAEAGGRRPVALAENGSLPDPEELTRGCTPWLWFMTWGGMTMDERITPLDNLKRVYGNPRAVTSEGLPGSLFD